MMIYFLLNCFAFYMDMACLKNSFIIIIINIIIIIILLLISDIIDDVVNQ